MKLLSLSKEKFAIVDDEDYEYLNQWKWHVRKSRSSYYATRTDYLSGCTHRKYNRNKIDLHTIILKTNKHIHFINRNSLDCRKENLIPCFQHNYLSNRPKPKVQNPTSKYKGVHYVKRVNKFMAQITCNKKNYYLGYYSDEEDAARAYDNAAKKLFVEFAKTNF